VRIYAPLPADGTVLDKPVFFEAREDAEAYIKAEDLNAVVTEYSLVPMVFHQEARPFIVFPRDDSTEGWIQVARDLQEMFTYAIDQKVEAIAVQYVDRRLLADDSEPHNYGLAVVLSREKMPNSEFLEQINRKSNNSSEP